MVSVSASETTVRTLIEDIFGALGFTADEQTMLAEVLLDASRRGNAAHGVARIPVYFDHTREGMIRPAVVPVVTGETTAATVIDARHCLGAVSTVFAIERATAKARQAGIGCATVRNGNDIGRLGSYVDGPARDGLITLLMANKTGGAACVAPVGSTTPFLSTNPIAVGIPRATGRDPLVIDLSTSVVSLGKVRMAANRGEAVPEGWLIDRDGRPVTDPNLFLAIPREAALLPLGGVAAEHKGFLLSLIVEAFAGALTGTGTNPGGHLGRTLYGLFVLAVDPGQLVGHRDFTREIETIVAALEALPHTRGKGPVRIPGTRSADAPAGQILIDGTTWSRIRTILQDLSLTDNYPVATMR